MQTQLCLHILANPMFECYIFLRVMRIYKEADSGLKSTFSVLIQLKLEIPILVQTEIEIFDFRIKNFDN